MQIDSFQLSVSLKMAHQNSEENSPCPSMEESTQKAHDEQIGVYHDRKYYIPFLKVKRLSERASLPQRAFSHSAAYDLFSATDAIVPARGKAFVPTDLSIEFPQGTYGRIASRSSLAWKHSIDVGGGVVDADGNPVFVVLYNHSDIDFQVKIGDNIAQMVIELNATPQVVEVPHSDSTMGGTSFQN